MTKYIGGYRDDVEWIEITCLGDREPTFTPGLELVNGEKPRVMTMTNWRCEYCGSWVSLIKLRCTQCGAPRA